MNPTHTNAELDSLIEQITIDCYDEDEQLMGFENAFDDANFPCLGTVIGETIEVQSISPANNRRELIATCQRNGHRYEIALLDIDINADPDTSRGLYEELCRHERKRSPCLRLREAGTPLTATAACWSATGALRAWSLGSRRGCPATIAASS